MSVVHVVPEGGLLEHNTADGIGCWCLPTAEDHGVDDKGKLAAVIVHVRYDDRLIGPLSESESLDADEDED